MIFAPSLATVRYCPAEFSRNAVLKQLCALRSMFCTSFDSSRPPTEWTSKGNNLQITNPQLGELHSTGNQPFACAAKMASRGAVSRCPGLCGNTANGIRASLLPVRRVGVRQIRFPRREACLAVKPLFATSGQPDGPTEDEEEARLETLEASTRGRRAALVQESEPKEDVSGTAMADWKEGKALPEGWDKLDVGQKAYELYAGKRGLLFWMNRIALWSVGGIIVAWILFRFVGPSLGLYELKSTLQDIQY